MSDKTFTIIDKKYHRNLPNKVNTVYFRYNNKDFEIDVLYIKTYNRYAFVQKWGENQEEFKKRLYEMGINSMEARKDFLRTLNKYSRLGQMKDW